MKNNVLQKDVAILHWTSQNLIDQNERKLFDDCTNNLNFFLKIRFVYIGGEKIKRWRYFHSIRLRGIFKLDVSYNYEKKKKNPRQFRLEKELEGKKTLDRKCGHDFAKLRNLGSSGKSANLYSHGEKNMMDNLITL